MFQGNAKQIIVMQAVSLGKHALMANVRSLSMNVCLNLSCASKAVHLPTNQCVVNKPDRRAPFEMPAWQNVVVSLILRMANVTEVALAPMIARKGRFVFRATVFGIPVVDVTWICPALCVDYGMACERLLEMNVKCGVRVTILNIRVAVLTSRAVART